MHGIGVLHVQRCVCVHGGVWVTVCNCVCALFARPASQINFLCYTTDWSWCYRWLISVVLSRVWNILYVIADRSRGHSHSGVTSLYLTQTSPADTRSTVTHLLIFTPKCKCAHELIETFFFIYIHGRSDENFTNQVFSSMVKNPPQAIYEDDCCIIDIMPWHGDNISCLVCGTRPNHW